mmetsp:Transcript_136267/g.436003  ORF Transcript_136267/g.436003 Transcript_136267/m.436003 type:complete len:246 (-) Transcript_136267:1151-1888(-)
MRHRLPMASSGQQPRSRMTSWASSRPRLGLRSAMKPSPIFSSVSPLRTCCLDSEMVTESPRLNFRRSKFVFGGKHSEPISLPLSSQPIMETFFGSLLPKTPVQGRPSRHQPSRCSSASGSLWVRRLICRSSSMCSKCMSMQKCPKYSAASLLLSCVTKRPLSLFRSTCLMAWRASLRRFLFSFSLALAGSTMRIGSGNLVLSRITNHPPIGGPLTSRAFQARASPVHVFLLNHQPLRSGKDESFL